MIYLTNFSLIKTPSFMDFNIFEEVTIMVREVMIRITAMAEAKDQFCVTFIWVYIITEINRFPQSPPTMRGMIKAAMTEV